MPAASRKECAASTVEAMKKAGPKRLILESAAVLFPGKGLLFAFLLRLLK
jgi:hypothetical protein